MWPSDESFLNIFKWAIFLFDTYYWFKDIKQRKQSPYLSPLETMNIYQIPLTFAECAEGLRWIFISRKEQYCSILKIIVLFCKENFISLPTQMYALFLFYLKTANKYNRIDAIWTHRDWGNMYMGYTGSFSIGLETERGK